MNNLNNRPRPAAQNNARRANNARPGTQRPANRPAAAKSAPKKAAPKKKNTSFLVKAFVTLAAIAFVIVIVQKFQGADNFDIMSLFETKPTEYDTSASANVQNGTNGMLSYPARTDNTKYLDIDSSHGILVNLRNNTVIAEKNGSERIYPASMTKVLTLIVAYENVKDLDDTFTFDFDIVNDAYVAGASVAGFTTGETVTIRDLLYGTVLPSGADATTALAQYIAGDEVAFAALMNQKAEEIGMKNSHFVTASGLHDDNHYSTCEDMALALKYAIATPEMREILSTYTYTTTKTPEHPDGIMLFSTMYTKMKGDEPGEVYIQGGKTGYTPEAHNCLASFAARCQSEDADLTVPQFILVTGGGIGEYAAIYDAINTYKKYT